MRPGTWFARHRWLSAASATLVILGVGGHPTSARANEVEQAASDVYARCLAMATEGSGPGVEWAEGSSSDAAGDDGSAGSGDGRLNDESSEFGGLIVPMLAELSDHACTEMLDPTACAQWLRETSCDGLANALLPSVTEDLQSLSQEFAHLQSVEEMPLWAGAVSDAMVAWITRCYSLEAGTAMTSEEGAALREWGRVLGQSLVMMTRGMEVDPQVAAACSQEVESWSCDVAGGQDLSDLPLSDEDSACGQLLTFDETFGEQY